MKLPILSTGNKGIILSSLIMAHYLSSMPVVGAYSYQPTMDAGYYQACNVVNGFIQCWGHAWGVAAGDAATPLPINQEPFGDAKPVQVKTGWDFEMYLLDNGKVYIHGRVMQHSGENHKIYGAIETTENYIYDPVPMQLLSETGTVEELADVIDIEVSDAHACAIHTDRTLTCWGGVYDYGQTDPSTIAQYDGTSNSTMVKLVALGQRVTCVVSFDNNIECFGVFTMSYQADYDVLQIQMGESNHACMIVDKADDNVMCFGRNHYGQLGDGTINGAFVTPPVTPVDLGHAKFVGVGFTDYSCAVLDDNSQKCWGNVGSLPIDQANEVLGTAATTSNSPTGGDYLLVPEEVVATNAIDFKDASIISIQPGRVATYLLLSDNRIYSWGWNHHAVLGVGTNDGDFKISGPGSAQLVHLNTTIPPLPDASMVPSFTPSSFPTEKPSLSPSHVPSTIPSSYPTISPQPSISSFSWDVELVIPGYLKDPPIADGVHQFVSMYNISDRDYAIEVFKTDCLTPSNGLPLVETIDAKEGGANSLKAMFVYNQTVIQSSSLWSANTTGGDVDFCLKLSLYSNSSNGILFNFIETIYKIEVDLTTGFSTQVDAIRTASGDGGVETIDIDENVTVYQCNDSYVEIESPPALTQGDALQICVETEDDSMFEVGNFKDVTVSQNGTKTYKYVSNFVDSYWASTSCIGTNTSVSVCKLKIQLLGEYFSDSDPVNLIVEGDVKMDYLGRRRVLKMKSSSGGNIERDGNRDDRRSLDEKQYENAGADFTLEVPVVSPAGSSNNADKEDDADVGSIVDLDDVSSATIIISSLVTLLATGIAMIVGNRFIN